MRNQPDFSVTVDAGSIFLLTPHTESALDWIKLTREVYLELAYFGNPPDELGPEEEAELPEEFQLPSFRQNYDEE